MKEENNSSAKKIYSIFMALFYLALAVILLFTSALDNFIPVGLPRTIVGVLFVLYSLFRGYRVWKG